MRTYPQLSRSLLLVVLCLLVVASFPPLVRGEPPVPPTATVNRPQRPRPTPTSLQASVSPKYSPAIEEVSKIGGEGAYRAVAISGNRAYVGMGNTLGVLDISDPVRPLTIGRATLPDQVYEIHVMGNVVYAVTREAQTYAVSTFQAVDVTDLAHPTVKSQFDVRGATFTTDVEGNLVYVAGVGGFVVFDASNPISLTLRGQFLQPLGSNSIDVVGGFAYIATEDGLVILDVRNPASPSFYSKFSLSEETRYAFHDVEVIDNRAYLTVGRTGLVVVDVSDPAVPRQIGQYGASYGDDASRNLRVVGNIAYAVDYKSLSVIDVSNPARTVRRSVLSLPSDLYDSSSIEVVDGLAYITTGGLGLAIIDISSPINPTLVTRSNSIGFVPDIQVVNNYAYLAANVDGLQILDVSASARPTVQGDFINSAEGLPAFLDTQLVGNLAYVADFLQGLEILDLTNPVSPTLVSKYRGPIGFATGIDVVSDLAYVVHSGGLVILDVSNPISPTLRSTFDEITYPSRVRVVGTLAYVTDESGLAIIDVSVPMKPRLLGRYDIGIPARNVSVIGNLAYVADEYGLDIVDVSNPIDPILRGYYDVPRTEKPTFSTTYYDVQVVGSLVYLAHDREGLRILDVSNPSKPTLRASYDGVAYSVRVAGDLVYVGGQGFTILRVHPERFGYTTLYLPLVQR